MRALGVSVSIVSLLGLALLGGCSRGDKGIDPAYQRDIDRLCHAEEHSGAGEVEPARRPVLIAQWLAENLETDEVSDVLAEFQAGSPAEKRAILEREAAAVGLPDCPLADTWAEASTDSEGAAGDDGG